DLTDVNDVTPVVTAGQSFTLPENSANTTVVGTVLATDGDVTPTTFQGWPVDRRAGRGAFAIDPPTGPLSVANAAALDREAVASFSMLVTVSDGLNTSAPQAVTVDLTDVNDVTPVLTAGQSFSLAENSASGTAVGTVLASDGDVTPTAFQG